MTLTSKLVLRVLDANGHLLGWCAHEAAVKGDGLLRAAGLVVVVLDAPGVPTSLSIHWADVNSEIVLPLPVVPMADKGTPLAIFQPNQPMLIAGEPPKQRLAPVSTQGPVAIGVPCGMLGSTGAPVMEITGAK